MNDDIAEQLLAKVMGWQVSGRGDLVDANRRDLQLLSAYKYDEYQRFGPGQRFIESLAIWLDRMRSEHRETALEFVRKRLIYVSDAEFLHLVRTVYPDIIVPERMRLVAGERGLRSHQVERIAADPRFTELGIKSLYLGLSDGARTSEIRRMSAGGIGHEQIWQAYELGAAKGKDLLRKLGKSLEAKGLPHEGQRFTLVWLLDDFAGSGNTYIRIQKNEFEGKLTKAFGMLHEHELVDPSHYEVYLLLYIATRQAVDHIEYWSERFTSERGYKPLQIRVAHLFDDKIKITSESDPALQALIDEPDYYDDRAHTDHTAVGRTANVRRGFANCALPVVLGHNTPNNSIYLLWGEETFHFKGLFPRVSRHSDP
jgi:hypothetical protein